MTEEPLFNSTHQALMFAFNFAGQQSPRTPMTSLMKSASLGSGKGLSGVDGASQSGMILAEVCRLPDDQHNVIVARYDRVMHDCKCCDQPTPSDEWRAAIDALSHCFELEGVHRTIRLKMVETAIRGGKLDIDRLSKGYSLSSRTLYRQLADIKVKFRKLERIAMINLDNAFIGSRLVA